MSERSDFSKAELVLIARAKKAGASLEKGPMGWGFQRAPDKALKLIKDIAGIRFLDLFEACENGEVSDEGLAHIKGMTDLRSVALGPGISDVGLAHLTGLTELTELRLDSAQDVTDGGLGALTALTKLQNLSLQYTDVTDAGLVHLAGFKKLKELNLEGTAVRQQAVGALQKKLPKCKILWTPAATGGATSGQGSRRASKPQKEEARQEPRFAGTPPQLTLRTTLRGHANKCGDAAFSPDGTLLVAVAFNKVLVWDLASGEKKAAIVLKRGSLWGAAVSPDGKLIAAGSNLGCVYVWDTTGKEEMRLETDNAVFTAVDFDPSGRFLSAGGQDGKLYLWELSTGKLCFANPATASDFFSAAVFSPDGKSVATCGRESFVSLWSVPAGEKIRELHAPRHKNEYEKINDVAFSPDGATLIAATADKHIRLWTVAQGKEVGAIPCARQVNCLVFHPQGNVLATGSDGDNSVRLVDLATKKLIAEFGTNADWNSVNMVAFSPSGAQLATNGKGGSVLVLDCQGPGWPL